MSITQTSPIHIPKQNITYNHCSYIDHLSNKCYNDIWSKETFYCKHHAIIIEEEKRYYAWKWAHEYIKDHIYCSSYYNFEDEKVHIYISHHVWELLKKDKGYTLPSQVNEFDEGVEEIYFSDPIWYYTGHLGELRLFDTNYPSDYEEYIKQKSKC
jgi:hypothetical protein